jgi:hypothetical protein
MEAHIRSEAFFRDVPPGEWRVPSLEPLLKTRPLKLKRRVAAGFLAAELLALVEGKKT